MIILRIFIFLYGALTILAIVEEARATQLSWIHAIYVVFSLSLMVVSVRLSPEWLLYLGLTGLLVVAVVNGFASNTFRWSHIFVRIGISIVSIILWRIL